MAGSLDAGAIALDTREKERSAWARTAIGDASVSLQRASMDAGFRSYWRAGTRDGSRIVMDSPPSKEDVRPWLAMHDVLGGGGVRVPTVLARDVAQGFLLLEDLGALTCLQVIDDDNADAMFADALGQLLRLQAITVPAGLPEYDEALLARELSLFDDWFLHRHLGVALDNAERRDLAAINRLLIDSALAQPQVLVHRDFMPRNLMPVADGDGPAVLDFQDAVRGPVAYDAVSLFKDAFMSWPASRVVTWLQSYHVRAVDAGIPVPPLPQFLHDADLTGVQRHLKVLGIFARLHHRDDKPRYLADAPRFLAYLDEVVPRHDALAPLGALLDRHVRPALAAASPP